MAPGHKVKKRKSQDLNLDWLYHKGQPLYRKSGYKNEFDSNRIYTLTYNSKYWESGILIHSYKRPKRRGKSWHIQIIYTSWLKKLFFLTNPVVSGQKHKKYWKSKRILYLIRSLTWNEHIASLMPKLLGPHYPKSLVSNSPSFTFLMCTMGQEYLCHGVILLRILYFLYSKKYFSHFNISEINIAHNLSVHLM